MTAWFMVSHVHTRSWLTKISGAVVTPFPIAVGTGSIHNFAVVPLQYAYLLRHIIEHENHCLKCLTD